MAENIEPSPKRRRLWKKSDLVEYDKQKLQHLGSCTPASPTFEALPTREEPSDESVPEEEICYGMLQDVVARSTIKQSNANELDQESVALTLHRPNNLQFSTSSIEYGKLSERWTTIICALDDAGCRTQLFCQNERLNSGSKLPLNGPPLFANIYGPLSVADEVGHWLDENKLYLQDPICCDRNVLYKNPHLLYFGDEEPIYTFALELIEPETQTEILDKQHNLLDVLNVQYSLVETDQPSIVGTQLYRHQKQALTFMLKREQGLALDEPGGDVWSREKNRDGDISYVNNVTGESRTIEPPDVRAGLLADRMGLGKSLSIISLIAANPYDSTKGPASTPLSNLTPNKTTLLVAPLSLLETWESQLHRLARTKRYVELVHLPWKPKDQNSRPHIIQNRKAAISQAVCSLHARNRWAVTGTPIQNKLTDIASLFEFLKIYPYSNPRIFEKDIVQRWHEDDEQGYLRVKTLINFVALYRKNTAIELPGRIDEVRYLDFSKEESELYQSTRDFTRTMLSNAIAGGPNNDRGYFNVLQWLNQLRLICNHGLLQGRNNISSSSVSDCSDTAWTHVEAQQAFSDMLGAGNASCAVCSSNLAESNLEDVSANSTEFFSPRLSQCLHLNCGTCHPSVEAVKTCCPTCGSNSTCQSFSVSFNSIDGTGSSNMGSPRGNLDIIPTKVQALLAALKSSPSGEKSVVFSFWTKTLDIVSQVLKSALILHTRLDGKLNQKKRSEAIRQFQEDDDIQVILVSITCGGAGLDLTAGSMVYLLEPQWNPMMEEQALCRVHRMGQKKPVTTIRFRMKDSFETKVVEIQERKKDLAALTLSQKKVSKDDINISRLQYLRLALA